MIDLDCIRYSEFDNGPDQCQPCQEFHYEDSYYGYTEHQCPLCSGWRIFCLNCYRDHHRNGWNSCNHSPVGELPKKCGRSHPLCLKQMDNSPAVCN